MTDRWRIAARMVAVLVIEPARVGGRVMYEVVR